LHTPGNNIAFNLIKRLELCQQAFITKVKNSMKCIIATKGHNM